MKILFIGGNGNISWWCVQQAIEKGYDVWELNRSMTRKTRRAVQKEVHQIICDARDRVAMKEAIKGHFFDVVCDFISYNGKQAEQMVDLFLDKTNQYIVISSEVVYKRKSGVVCFNENSEKYSLEEVENCSYIKGKIEVENYFSNICKSNNFPITIVRPGYTYDTIVPTPAGGNCFTAIYKMEQGKPMIMYGDGNNLWAPMHSRDFSKYFIGLCGNKNAIGEDYNIVGQELLTWNEMVRYVMEAFQVEKNEMIHIPKEEIENNVLFGYNELVKQKMSDYVFDICKINNLVKIDTPTTSFRKGIQETARLLMDNKDFQRIDDRLLKQLDKIYLQYIK